MNADGSGYAYRRAAALTVAGLVALTAPLSARRHGQFGLAASVRGRGRLGRTRELSFFGLHQHRCPLRCVGHRRHRLPDLRELPRAPQRPMVLGYDDDLRRGRHRRLADARSGRPHGVSGWANPDRWPPVTYVAHPARMDARTGQWTGIAAVQVDQGIGGVGWTEVQTRPAGQGWGYGGTCTSSGGLSADCSVSRALGSMRFRSVCAATTGLETSKPGPRIRPVGVFCCPTRG